MSTATLPDLKGFTTYYGLQVSDIGEDGNLIVLGHHHDQPLRVAAALNKHARNFWGLTNLLDDPGARIEDLADSLHETYAVLLNRCDDPGHELSCWRCQEISEADWWIEWNHAADEVGAFPVTIWRP